MGFIDWFKRLFIRRKLGKASKRMRAINASYKKDPDILNEQTSEGELGGAVVSRAAGAESKPDVDNFVADRTASTRLIRADIPKTEIADPMPPPDPVVYTEKDEKERMRELDALTKSQKEKQKPKSLPVTKYRKYPELADEIGSKTKNVNKKTMNERKQSSVDDTPVSVGKDFEPTQEAQPQEQDYKSVTVPMPDADENPPEWAKAAQQKEERQGGQRGFIETGESGAVEHYIPSASQAETYSGSEQAEQKFTPKSRMSGVMAMAEGRKAEENIIHTKPDEQGAYIQDGVETGGTAGTVEYGAGSEEYTEGENQAHVQSGLETAVSDIRRESTEVESVGESGIPAADAENAKHEEEEQAAGAQVSAGAQVMEEAAAAVSGSRTAEPVIKPAVVKQPRVKTAEQLKREQERAIARAKAAEQKKLEKAKLNAEKAEQNKIERERVRAEKREADRLERIKVAAERKVQQQTEREAAKQEEERLAKDAAENSRLAAEQAEAERLAEVQRIEREAAARQEEEDRLAKEAAIISRLAAEQAEAERLAEEQRIEREATAKQEEEDRLAKEAAIISRLAAEQAEAERLAAERLAAEQAEEARIASIRAEKDRIAKEKAEAERLAGLAAEKERLAAERAEKARIAAEKKAEEKRIAKEQADKEKQEKAEAARLERERIAAEKAEALRIEKERAAAEKAERDRIAALEKAEALRIEKERAAAEKAEKERVAAALKAEEERLNKIKKEEEQRLAEENRRAEEASKAAMKKADEDAKAAGLEAKKKFNERKLPAKTESFIKDKADKPAPKAAAPKIKPIEPATPSRDAQKISAPPKVKVQENEAGLRLLFQPVIFAPKQQLYGYECLLRIYDAELGVIEPKIFLDIAQKDIRIIKKLEDWSFEELLDVSKKLKDKNLSMLSINISSRNFYEASFIDSIKKIMAQEKSVPTNIYMEFREDVLFSDPVTVETKFNILRSMGIKIAIDDFGKDYFTSATRPTFKLDMVKIGYGYIKDVLVNTRSKSVVRAILAYAKEFKADVVAVGVETKEQEDALLKLGCKKMQGYLYSKPVKEQKMLSKK